MVIEDIGVIIGDRYGLRVLWRNETVGTLARASSRSQTRDGLIGSPDDPQSAVIGQRVYFQKINNTAVIILERTKIRLMSFQSWSTQTIYEDEVIDSQYVKVGYVISNFISFSHCTAEKVLHRKEQNLLSQLPSY